jgi:hypothetical protein
VVQKGLTKGARGSSPKGRETAAQIRHDGGGSVGLCGPEAEERGKGVTGCSGALVREDPL